MKIPDVNRKTPDTLVSVCCVLLGFDENELHVLLEKQAGLSRENPVFVLPGRLLETGEEPGAAIHALLDGLPGRRRIRLNPFRTYTFPVAPSCADGESHSLQAARLIAITYSSLYKMAGKVSGKRKKSVLAWYPAAAVSQVLTIDEQSIVSEAKKEMQRQVESDPAIVFEFLPQKFTALQLRRFYEILYGKPIDIRNFHKRMGEQPYIVPLEEWEESVPHRAARYYHFSRIRYNRQRKELYVNE